MCFSSKPYFEEKQSILDFYCIYWCNFNSLICKKNFSGNPSHHAKLQLLHPLQGKQKNQVIQFIKGTNKVKYSKNRVEKSKSQ